MPYTQLRLCQSAVNGQDGSLAACQQSKYPKTVVLTVKISLVPRPPSSFLSVMCQHSQCYIFAVPIGIKQGLGNEAGFNGSTEQGAYA